MVCGPEGGSSDDSSDHTLWLNQRLAGHVHRSQGHLSRDVVSRDGQRLLVHLDATSRVHWKPVVLIAWGHSKCLLLQAPLLIPRGQKPSHGTRATGLTHRQHPWSPAAPPAT